VVRVVRYIRSVCVCVCVCVGTILSNKVADDFISTQSRSGSSQVHGSRSLVKSTKSQKEKCHQSGRYNLDQGLF